MTISGPGSISRLRALIKPSCPALKKKFRKMFNPRREQLQTMVSQIDTELTILCDQERSYKECILAETNEGDKFRLLLKLETLAHTHAGMKHAKAAILALFAPVTTLPDELLSYIFFLAARPPDHVFPEFFDNARLFPLLIAQVCQQWRKVVFATPDLWTYLTFRDYRQRDFPHFHTERLSLERSRSSLIYIHIHWAEDHNAAKAMTTILGFLLPNFHRVYSFHAAMWDKTALQIILNHLPAFAPELRILYLEYRAVDQHALDIPFLAAGAPRLSHAAFSSVNLPWDTLPFTNLQSLSLVGHPRHLRPSWSQFSRVLSTLPRLRTLEMTCFGPSFDRALPLPAWSAEQLILPVVRFQLLDVDPEDATKILKRLILPNIRFVTLHFDGDLMINNILRERKTFATARRLSVNDTLFAATCVTDEIIRDSFGFPNVTELILESSSALFTALSNPFTPCFPQLKVLTVSNISGNHMRSLILGRMAHHGFPPLEFVRILKAKDTAQEDLVWLSRHVRLYFQPSYV